MQTDPWKIGVDLGGTKAEVILLDPSDRERYRNRARTPRDEDYESVVRTLRDAIQAAAGAIPEGDRKEADEAGTTVGMGIPGMIHRSSGRVFTPNLSMLNDRRLGEDLSRALGMSVRLDNDANCFLRAECRNGAGRGFGVVFGVVLGTGCGGALSVHGNIWSGANGFAGEWGHISIDPDGPRCGCGKRGCIETRIGGAGVERTFRRRFGREASMEEIVTGFRAGESDAVAVFEQFLEDFGRSLGGMISVFDPDAVVVGGGLSAIPELYNAGAERVRAWAYRSDARTPILQAELGDAAGVFGAAWLGAEQEGAPEG
ncbi:MAG: ROK family protein [Desulfococcaceae bacterium]